MESQKMKNEIITITTKSRIVLPTLQTEVALSFHCSDSCDAKQKKLQIKKSMKIDT